MKKRIVDVEERLPLLETIPLSFQHLFAMVGSTILVPIITHMSPSIALFCSGIGTLLYILCTKAKLPAYIGSSFAFISPMLIATAKFGQPAMQGGIIAAGIIYVIVSTIIRFTGIDWLNKALPPIVVGSVVIVIGLSLAGTAIDWAGLSPTPSATVAAALKVIPLWKWITVSMVTLIVGIIGSMYFKGFMAVIPILFGMICGYITALFLGVIPEEAIRNIVTSPLFIVPKFMLPKFNWGAVTLIAPISFVTIAEHIGHVYVTNNVVGRDFTKDPGLHRSLLGDGIATMFAGIVGGPPNTTYGENIGVMAITKVYSVWVIGIAAVIAVILSFIGPVSAIIENMPLPVIGGISILLFGIIASSGLRIFVEDKVDFSMNRNLIIASVILVLGIGGATIKVAAINISGVALATLAGIFLNLVLPEKSKAE